MTVINESIGSDHVVLLEFFFNFLLVLSFPIILSSRAVAFLSALACSRLCSRGAAACVCVNVLSGGELRRVSV